MRRTEEPGDTMINKTARTFSPLMLAACALSLALAACSSSGNGGPANSEGGRPVADRTPAKVEAADKPVVAAQEAGGAESAPAKLDEATIQSAEARYLTSRAAREIGAGALSDAQLTVSELAQISPGNPNVAVLQAQIDTALKTRAGTTPGSAEAEALSTLGEYLAEAERIYGLAKDAEARGDWRAVEQQYNRLNELIAYAPFKAELRDRYEAKALAGQHNARVELRKIRDMEELDQVRDQERINQLLAQSRDQRKREEIVELWRQALYQLELKNFNRATELVDRILHLDREFEQARKLRTEIESMRLENIRRDVFERKMLGYRNALLELRMAMVPDITTVTFAQGELARMIRARRDNLPDAVRLDKDVQAIQAQLDSTIVRLDYSGQTLAEVIKFIRSEAGVNILLKVDSPDAPVNLEIDNVPLSSVLNILCQQQGLKQVFRNGILMIVSAEEDVSDELVTRVHDIRDITYQIQHFQAPTINLRSNDSGGGGLGNIGGPDEDVPAADDIVEFIIAGVAPDTWNAPRAAEAFGGQLVVTHTAAVQAQIREFLNSMRKTAGLLVAIEARFITIQDDFLSDFGIDFRGLGGPSSVPNQANLTLEDISSNNEDNAGGAFDNGNLGVPTASPSAGIFFNPDDPRGPVNFNRDVTGRFENIFDNSLGSRLSNIGGMAMQVAIFQNLTQINAVIQAVQKTGRARTLISPRLSAYNTQRSNIAIINQVPYIRDFEVQSAAASAIANPVMDTILDGIVLEVVPTISNDRRFITVEVQPTIAELLLPIPTFVTTLGPSSAVTIQIPELRVQSAKTTVRVPDGGAVVIGGLKTARDVDRESSTPILGDLPLLGVLFRRKGRSVEQSNLVIVIKAHVVDLSDEELRQPGWN